MSTPAQHPLTLDRIWVVDLAVAAGLLLASLVLSAVSGTNEGLLTVLLVASVALRRKRPATALAVGALAAVGQLVMHSGPSPSIAAVPVLVYSLARWASPEIGKAALVTGLVGSVLGPLRWAFGAGNGLGLLGLLVMVLACAGIVVAAFLVGARRRESVENLQQRAVSAAETEQLRTAEEVQRAQVATAHERTRIARELHDIVAHSLSVIVVQAEGGKALAARRPEQASEVLTTIAETSRQALDEMRRMVGLLRGGEPEQAAYAPMPSLLDIPELVHRTSERATLRTYGEPPPVSPALGLTAYRIVQESLTNVLKHAGPQARAGVTVAYTAATIELEVVDDGGAATAPETPLFAADGRTPGPGHGLQGMAERVALHAGTVSAEPGPDGGFVVRASLPLDVPPTLPPAL